MSPRLDPGPPPTAAGVPAHSLRADRPRLAALYREVRAESIARAAPLSPEDQCVQSMPDASPTKWHLAHTTWFFEALLLQPHAPGYMGFDDRFFYLFNSYYEALGPRHPRPQRGLLSRPPLADVHAYRIHVDQAMLALIAEADDGVWATVRPLLELGLHHEQQHQELLLTDVLHLLSCNPMLPAYCGKPAVPATVPTGPARWLPHAGGVVAIGHSGDGFAFDNEGPRHEVLLRPFAIADRLVTCGDFARFIAAGGYRRPGLWLSAGWDAVQAGGWRAPAYWVPPGDPRLPAEALHADAAPEGWHVYGPHGLLPLDPQAPVQQLSFFEAAAYAEWAGARLPTEAEWQAACGLPGFEQGFGVAWQWTRSSYDPYPGFRPAAGAVAEYNGKFMVGQIVLRGSSLATPRGHARPSYRNFFPPAARWQFSGLRLAKDL